MGSVGWAFSERFFGISLLWTKTAGEAPLISHRADTCIRYISAYMFEELWLLANHYPKCGPMLDVWGRINETRSISRDHHQRVSDDDLSLAPGK